MAFSLIVTVFNNLEGIDVFKKDLPIYNKYFDEIIIIDDSSDDGSWEVLQRLKSKKNLIIRQTPFNSGRPSLPRNMGLEIASKKFVTFLDIGDRISEKYLRHTQKQIVINDLNFYSGIKTTYRNLDKTNLTQGDVAFQIKISKFILNYKNFTLLSGLTVSLKFAKKNKFEKIFFEDWIFVKKLIDENLNCYLVFSPIYYQTGHSNISKGKIRQISRFKLNEKRILNLLLYGFLSSIKFFVEKIFKVCHFLNAK